MISLLITISIVSTLLFLIAIFDICYAIVIKHQIKNLKNELNRQEVVNYINNSMQVYVRDEQGNILKHHAHISSFNLNDCQKIIIDIDKNE
jgi:hypothetical protein